MLNETPRLHITYLKLVLMGVFWGGTFVAGRITARHIPAFSASFLRFACASLILLWVLRRVHGRFPTPTWNQWYTIASLGFCAVFLYNIFFFKGLELVSAARAALIIANNPVFIALFAAVLFREPLGLRRFLGILLSVCGAIVVITRGDPAQVFQGSIGSGELFILGCVASWVSASLLGKLLLIKDLSPLIAVSYSSALGTLALLPLALWEGMAGQLGSYPAEAWLSVLFLGVCGTVLGFLWYYEGIAHIGAVRAGQFINLVPPSAVVLAWLLLDETLTPLLAVGGLLILSGVYLTNRSPLGTSADPAGKK